MFLIIIFFKNSILFFVYLFFFYNYPKLFIHKYHYIFMVHTTLHLLPWPVLTLPCN